MEITARIPPRNIKALEKAFASVNRKAEKLGASRLTLDIGDAYSVEEYDLSRQRTVTRVYHDVTVMGVLPKLSGWTLVARIDHTGPRNVIVSAGEHAFEIDPAWRTANPDCDHCQHQRLRNDTFLLVSDSGEWKQVGRNCLKDFVGSDNPARVLNLFLDFERTVNNFDDYGTDEGRVSPYINTIRFLSYVAALINEWGWYSRTAWRNNDHVGVPTADRVMAEIWSDDHDALEPADSDREEAKAAFEWVRSKADEPNLNDYEYNLVALTDIDAFDYTRYTGIMASIIPAYRREHGLEQETGKKKEITSTHQGKVKERKDWTLTLTKRVDMEVPAYGYRGVEMLRIHLFEDDDGNIFVWKTTSKRLAEGETYIVRGTVKEHGEYNGVPQTILTRCAITCPECGKDPRDDDADNPEYWKEISGDPDIYRNWSLDYAGRCWHCQVHDLVHV